MLASAPVSAHASTVAVVPCVLRVIGKPRRVLFALDLSDALDAKARELS